MNEDYQLEELENEAVNKSNTAKRVALAGGLLAAGGAATYAANNLPADEEELEPLDEEDLDTVTEKGAEQVQEPAPKPQPVPQPQPEPQPEPLVEEEESPLSFDKTTEVYENGELQGTAEEGTYEGRNFMMVDTNGDMRADIFAYDADGNGVYNEDEIEMLSGDKQIAMGHETPVHEIIHNNTEVVVIDPDPEPEPYVLEDEKDYAQNQEDIHNDFEDEKTGEDYSHDYAENNDDYNNNGDVDNYQANSEHYAYEDDVKGEDDYFAENEATEEDSYDSFAENDATDDDVFDPGDSIDMA